MGRSLFFKLLGAFALVIVVLAVVATVLANQATAGEFNTYNDQTGQLWAQRIAPALADYFSKNNTWEGVADVVQDPLALTKAVEITPSSPLLSPKTSAFTPLNQTSPTPISRIATEPGSKGTIPTEVSGSPGMRRGGMGPGMMGVGPTLKVVSSMQTPVPGLTQSLGIAENDPASITAQNGGMGPGMRGWRGTGASGNVDMWSMMGHRVIVADAAGRVVSDSSGEPSGAVLSSDQLSGGESIQVSGQPAGTVLVGASDTLPGTPAGEFLRAINRSILVAVLAAGVVALIMGGLLFYQITAPVRKLKAAACSIAAGDLSQRVQVRTRDELGDLGVAFNNMAESLSNVEAQRRRMVADVAHELRTPLSVMQANLEAMQDGLLPPDAEQIASLHEETVMLSRLVADLHLLSVAEAGQLKLERMEVEPGELIRKSAERLYLKAQEHGVSIIIETPPALAPVLADADRISQVIGNLVSNSLRYTSSGGAVTVKVQAVAAALAGQPKANMPQQTSAVLVSVTDTGSGIPEVDLLRVFDRFYRADKSRTRASGGSGLGLAIVKYIVEAHGGKIWAESPVWNTTQTQGRGTRISFTLPTSLHNMTVG